MYNQYALGNFKVNSVISIEIVGFRVPGFQVLLLKEPF